jgi:hypothetical protein
VPAPKRSSGTRARPSRPSDWWGLWFFRVVQLIGVVIVINEVFLRPDFRIDVAGVGLVMVSGALGVEQVAKWYLRR